MTLRHVRELAEKPVPLPGSGKSEWLVLFDHHAACIYRSTAPGAVPQQIRPHPLGEPPQPGSHWRDLPPAQMPSPANRHFEPVAGVLNGAGRILVFGSNTGAGGEMDQFLAWLKEHRPQLAQRVVGAVAIDAAHLTEEQVLAQARAHYATLPVAPP